MPWDSVNLTEEEERIAIAKGLSEARQAKFYTLAEQAKQEALRKATFEASRPWTAEELADYVLHTTAHRLDLRYKDSTGQWVKGFEITEDNTLVFSAMCYYFTKDKERFEALGREKFGFNGQEWDIDKGLYLYGPFGTGKTTMMDLFRWNKRQCYDRISTSEIAEAYAHHGVKAVSQFYTLRYNPMSDIDVFFQREKGIEFDDLGMENLNSAHFGTKKNVMTDIFLARYKAYQVRKLRRDQTHITSNKDADEIEMSYGGAVRSRFREQFNVVELLGMDRRK